MEIKLPSLGEAVSLFSLTSHRTNQLVTGHPVIMKSYLALAAFVCAVAVALAHNHTTGYALDGQICKDSTECGPDGCCVHSTISQRAVLFDHFDWTTHFKSVFMGKCRAIRKEGESCVPFGGKEFILLETTAHFSMCPCAKDLVCSTADHTNHDDIFGIDDPSDTVCIHEDDDHDGHNHA